MSPDLDISQIKDVAGRLVDSYLCTKCVRVTSEGVWLEGILVSFPGITESEGGEVRAATRCVCTTHVHMYISKVLITLKEKAAFGGMFNQDFTQ